MAESEASCSRTCWILTDMDMEAAQQLMQLSDEDNTPTTSNENKSKSKKRKFLDNEEYDESSSQSEITSKIIEEIFGKEEEEVVRPRKKKYRSLVSIYKAVPRLNMARDAKKVRR